MIMTKSPKPFGFFYWLVKTNLPSISFNTLRSKTQAGHSYVKSMQNNDKLYNLIETWSEWMGFIIPKCVNEKCYLKTQVSVMALTLT